MTDPAFGKRPVPGRSFRLLQTGHSPRTARGRSRVLDSPKLALHCRPSKAYLNDRSVAGSSESRTSSGSFLQSATKLSNAATAIAPSGIWSKKKPNPQPRLATGADRARRVACAPAALLRVCASVGRRTRARSRRPVQTIRAPEFNGYDSRPESPAGRHPGPQTG